MASLKSNYDVIVIGGGIEGSSSAYNLAKQGQKVLLLEQFPLPHTRGSSGGHSRITRYAYGQDFYVHMMTDCFPMWDMLAKESGSDLFVNCGTLDIRISGSASERNVSDLLAKYKVPHEILSPLEVSRRFPMIVSADPAAGAIWDPEGGLLKADKCLAAFQRVFKQLGGVIHAGEPVTSLIPGNQVTVVTSRGVYKANQVVVAAGPWTGKLTKDLGLDLPLQPVRINVLYWSAIPGKEGAHTTDKMPCVLDSRERGAGGASFSWYALPQDEYPGLVKVCLHIGPNIDPNERDRADSQFVRDKMTELVAEFFPWVRNDKPTIEETCIYTNTPDHHPFIGKHPKYSNIVIAAGFSGHGFKLAPAVGKAVSELVMNKKFSYNMEPFRVDRFSQKSNL